MIAVWQCEWRQQIADLRRAPADLGQLQAADELVVCNSVTGIGVMQRFGEQLEPLAQRGLDRAEPPDDILKTFWVVHLLCLRVCSGVRIE